MIKILYDYQTFVEQNYGGVSRYVNFLNKYIPKFGVKSKISVLLSNNEYLKDEHIGNTFFPHMWIPKKLLFMKYVNKAYSLFLIKSGKYDIFHATYFDGYYINKSSMPVVVTVYDMIHERFYDKYEMLRDDPFIERKKQALLNADMIIAISETTRLDVLELYPQIAPEKVRTVHLCLMLDSNKKQPLASQNDTEPYFLFVGNRNMYKDFPVLIKAMSLIAGPHYKVICAGGGNFTAEELGMIEEHKVEDYFINKSITNDEMLNRLYKNAIAYISTSAYEGFGLPVLEAFDNDCAVVLSDNACYREIAAEGADYFLNAMPEQLSLKMEQLFADHQYRQELKNRGKERLSFFNKERLLKETYDCYKVLSDSKHPSIENEV